MTKQELESEILSLKSDYIRIQSDLEKLDAVGGNTTNAEKQLEQIENQLADLNKRLDALDS